MKIIARDIPPRTVWALEQAGVHPLLARLFAARGVRGKDELDDGLVRLLPPDTLRGTRQAAAVRKLRRDRSAPTLQSDAATDSAS